MNYLALFFVLFFVFQTAPSAQAATKDEFVAGVKKLVREAKPADRKLFAPLAAAAQKIDDTPASMARYLIEQAKVSDALITRSKYKDIDASIGAIAEMATAAQNLKAVGAPVESAALLGKAAEHARKLTEKSPERSDVYFLLASIYFYDNRPTEMKAPLQRCLEIDPQDAACQQKMAVLTEVEAENAAAAAAKKTP